MKKKGFTLVELLAVIVIMAILALIAIPITINIISDSRENAHKRSIENYGREVENAYLQAKLDKKSINTLGDLISNNYLKMSGEDVVCDENSILSSDDGIELTNCYVKDNDGNMKTKYTYVYRNGKVEKSLTLEEYNQQSLLSKEYKIGDLITVSNEQYYVIANSFKGQDYVTVLKAEPLTTSEINDNRYGNEHLKHNSNYGFPGHADNYNGYGAVSYYEGYNCYSDHWMMQESGCIYDYNGSDIKYVVDDWANDKFQNEELKEIEGYKARLIKYSELINNLGYDENYKNEYDEIIPNENVPNWVYGDNYSYWMMGENNDTYLKYLGTNGRIYQNGTLNNGSIRPVINVYKTKITK